MKMIFSADYFKADTSARGLLDEDHLTALDGLEVIFNRNDEKGSIPYYMVGGIEYTLYPVFKQWCISQLSLF